MAPNSDAAKWTTLGEAVKKAGFNTHGESANGYIIAKWGFGEGWDSYQNHIHDGGGVKRKDIHGPEGRREDERQGKTLVPVSRPHRHSCVVARQGALITKYSPEYTGKYKTQASGQDVEAMATGKLENQRCRQGTHPRHL